MGQESLSPDPTMWQDYDRATASPTPGLDAEGVTPELLRLKFYCS
jgi:hypothetical protein